MITLKDVNLHYKIENKASYQALHQINFTIADGQHWAIIGPSGCGKSSLISLMAGLIQPTEGSVEYNQRALLKPHEEIGVILQEYGLFPWKTVWQNIALPLQLKKEKKLTINSHVELMLNKLGLWEHRDKFPAQLSGGQRQRVAIARVLVVEPSVLLMDEPFSALDALTRENLQNIVLELCREKGLTLILVTHNIEEAVFLGEHIVVFNQHPGKIAEIIANPHSGQSSYRNTSGFYEQCASLREAIRGGVSNEA